MGAMTKVTVRMVRDIPNDVWYDYWRGFRENWKASTVLGLITAPVYGGGLLGLVLYPAGSIIWLVTLAALLILTMVWLYLYPLLTSTTLFLPRLRPRRHFAGHAAVLLQFPGRTADF